ncbi:hypothetical protein FDI14_gp094 [Mycobacterium phage SirDuracell]|uniref:Uncharacterized protein n=24 Tax=Viruses TaxID=10239 RepID=Q857R6_9CAUD|nr:gp96 [Mycobacterium phage Cjw1]YP_002014414.1 hypothetical protein Porky_93 [Mycobacterium phage Porky]YP_002014562.1 hypothetical protein Kostya_94 [Mycobacterium phage Kostya]YP_008051573.1 hypothetical protein PBI_MURPHY_94 [Mycobacterium phage Murphy]YP_008051719.1 hypothetical protein PBI_DUMBO_94 [Mycobacterium phage Dumbo]YP_008052028.1 hypothetical protein PBI_PHRUX_92 [Mycobacterium phage Phrux]YP_008052271.1 hypothetical protein M039_gp097 [Mycobacterium phage Phaux]YP_008409487
MRPKIMVTNTDKNGKVTDSWFVRVGKKSRTFSAADAKTGAHVKWINEQLGAA